MKADADRRFTNDILERASDTASAMPQGTKERGKDEARSSLALTGAEPSDLPAEPSGTCPTRACPHAALGRPSVPSLDSTQTRVQRSSWQTPMVPATPSRRPVPSQSPASSASSAPTFNSPSFLAPCSPARLMRGAGAAHDPATARDTTPSDSSSTSASPVNASASHSGCPASPNLCPHAQHPLAPSHYTSSSRSPSPPTRGNGPRDSLDSLQGHRQALDPRLSPHVPARFQAVDITQNLDLEAAARRELEMLSPKLDGPQHELQRQQAAVDALDDEVAEESTVNGEVGELVVQRLEEGKRFLQGLVRLLHGLLAAEAAYVAAMRSVSHLPHHPLAGSEEADALLQQQQSQGHSPHAGQGAGRRSYSRQGSSGQSTPLSASGWAGGQQQQHLHPSTRVGGSSGAGVARAITWGGSSWLGGGTHAGAGAGAGAGRASGGSFPEAAAMSATITPPRSCKSSTSGGGALATSAVAGGPHLASARSAPPPGGGNGADTPSRRSSSSSLQPAPSCSSFSSSHPATAAAGGGVESDDPMAQLLGSMSNLPDLISQAHGHLHSSLTSLASDCQRLLDGFADACRHVGPDAAAAAADVQARRAALRAALERHAETLQRRSSGGSGAAAATTPDVADPWASEGALARARRELLRSVRRERMCLQRAFARARELEARRLELGKQAVATTAGSYRAALLPVQHDLVTLMDAAHSIDTDARLGQLSRAATAANEIAEQLSEQQAQGVEEMTAQLFGSREVVMQGPMLLLDDPVASWRPCHFVLTRAGFLHWFPGHAGGRMEAPLGSLSLARCRYEPGTDKCFHLLESRPGTGGWLVAARPRRYSFQLAHHEECVRWVVAIEDAIAAAAAAAGGARGAAGAATGLSILPYLR